MSITWIDDTCGYLAGAANIGVVRLDGDGVLLVDAGMDDDRSRKTLGALRAESLVPRAVFLTHAHADHLGGAALLVKRAGVRVVTSPGEAAFARRPYLEPYALHGLADPPPELQGKFLMATGVTVDEEVGPGPWHIPGGPEMTVLDLSGHAPWQCGLLVGGVCYAGDALFPPELWRKHRFIYQADITKTLAALDLLSDLDADVIVPAHGEPASPGDALIAGNREELNALTAEVLQAVGEGAREGGAGSDELVAMLCGRWGITFRGLIDFSLARATVHAALTHLVNQGSVRAQADGGRVRWLPV